jgi:hypothetical protein
MQRSTATRTVGSATVAMAAVASALLVLFTQVAAAAPARVATNTNLRQGPGTEHGVIATIPRGMTVEVAGCTGEWCNVQWHQRGGYVLARNLDLGGPAPGPGPGGPGGAPGPASGPDALAGPYPPPGAYDGPPAVVAEPYPYPYPYWWGPGPYWGPRYYVGPRWGYYRWRRW